MTTSGSLFWTLARLDSADFASFFHHRGYTLAQAASRARSFELVYDEHGATLFHGDSENPLVEGPRHLLQVLREFTVTDVPEDLTLDELVTGRRIKASGCVPAHVCQYLDDAVRYPVFVKKTPYSVQWRYREPHSDANFLLCLATDLRREAQLFS